MECAVIRVEVVSAHPVVRAGVQSLLELHPDRVVVAEDGVGADVVLYDVHGLTGPDGEDDLRLLVKRHPSRVVALSRDMQPGLVARALDLGAVGSVSLAADDGEILAVLLDATTGRLEDGSETDLANRRKRDHDLGRDVGLTAREQDVLALVVGGRSNAEIADLLFISTNTVKSFIRTAYAKIDVRTRSQAVAWGIRHGFGSQERD